MGSDDTLTACTTDPALDEATARAVLVIDAVLTEDIWEDTPGPGMFCAQCTITHELMHALAEREDHTHAQDNIIHAKHSWQRVLGADDEAYLHDAPRVSYTRNMDTCDIVVRWGDIGRATGLWDGRTVWLNATYGDRWHVP